MNYEVEFKPRAVKDLQAIPKPLQQRILVKVEALGHDLTGNVKRLTDHTPSYRLRVGDYRILFEVESVKITVYRIKHRSDAYGA